MIFAISYENAIQFIYEIIYEYAPGEQFADFVYNWIFLEEILRNTNSLLVFGVNKTK